MDIAYLTNFKWIAIYFIRKKASIFTNSASHLPPQLKNDPYHADLTAMPPQ